MNSKELLDYYIEHTNARLTEIKSELSVINDKLDSLSAFKWQTLGVCAFVLVLIELISLFK